MKNEEFKKRSVGFYLSQIVIGLIWILPILGAALGTFVLVTGFSTAQSAPQEATIAGLACACAILPYVFARSVTEIINQMTKN